MQRTAQSRQLNLRYALQNELVRRCDQNERYSLRAFARALGMSHTNLSLIMSGKRPISQRTYQKIARALDLDEPPMPPRVSRSDDPLFDQISLDHAAFRGEWAHAAILALLDTRQALPHPKAMARLLGIQEIQVRAALDRLRRLGLIASKGGRWSRDRLSKSVEGQIPPSHSRKSQRDFIDKAGFAIDNVSGDRAAFSTVVLPVHPDQLPALREMIASLQSAARQKCAGGPGGKAPSDVYALSIQLFPLTSRDGEPE